MCDSFDGSRILAFNVKHVNYFYNQFNDAFSAEYMDLYRVDFENNFEWKIGKKLNLKLMVSVAYALSTVLESNRSR